MICGVGCRPAWIWCCFGCGIGWQLISDSTPSLGISIRLGYGPKKDTFPTKKDTAYRWNFFIKWDSFLSLDILPPLKPLLPLVLGTVIGTTTSTLVKSLQINSPATPPTNSIRVSETGRILSCSQTGKDHAGPILSFLIRASNRSFWMHEEFLAKLRD